MKVDYDVLLLKTDELYEGCHKPIFTHINPVIVPILIFNFLNPIEKRRTVDSVYFKLMSIISLSESAA